MTKEIKTTQEMDANWWPHWFKMLLAQLIIKQVSRKIPGKEGKIESGPFIFERSVGPLGELVYTKYAFLDKGLEQEVRRYNGGRTTLKRRV